MEQVLCCLISHPWGWFLNQWESLWKGIETESYWSWQEMNPLKESGVVRRRCRRARELESDNRARTDTKIYQTRGLVPTPLLPLVGTDSSLVPLLLDLGCGPHRSCSSTASQTGRSCHCYCQVPEWSLCGLFTSRGTNSKSTVAVLGPDSSAKGAEKVSIQHS